MKEDHSIDGQTIPDLLRPRQHRSFRLTPTRKLSLQQVISLLRTEIPADFRTLVLSLLAGSVLSFPVGFVFAITIRPFDPPKWIEPFYLGAVVGSFVILPFWSHFALRSQPLLRNLGITVFQFGLLYSVLGMFFPAL